MAPNAAPAVALALRGHAGKATQGPADGQLAAGTLQEPVNITSLPALFSGHCTGLAWSSVTGPRSAAQAVPGAARAWLNPGGDDGCSAACRS